MASVTTDTSEATRPAETARDAQKGAPASQVRDHKEILQTAASLLFPPRNLSSVPDTSTLSDTPTSLSTANARGLSDQNVQAPETSEERDDGTRAARQRLMNSLIEEYTFPRAIKSDDASHAVKIGTQGISIGGWLILGEGGCPIADSRTMESIQSCLAFPPPEMLFSGNRFVAFHKASGFTLKLDAESALKSCCGKSTDLKVASAAVWSANKPLGDKKDFSGRTIEAAARYDWTYTPSILVSLYKISNDGGILDISPNISGAAAIPYEHLQQKERILWSIRVPLYSTELDDNGIAELSGRVRVMPSCFFCLFRYFLRLDNVLLKCKDVRVFHMFGSSDVLVEETFREGNIDGKHQYLEADVICRTLPLKRSNTYALNLA